MQLARRELPRPSLLGGMQRLFRMIFPRWQQPSGTSAGGWRSWSNWLLPGSTASYVQKAGWVPHNSAVAICLSVYADNFPEAPLQVIRQRRDGTEDPQPRHPLLALFETPNDEYDGDALSAATIVSYLIDGNAYWLKGRDGFGVSEELWWVPHWQMFPVPDDKTGRLSHWMYLVDGKGYRVERRDVVHFRFGVDPHRPHRGVSRAYPILREICGDNEASEFTEAILERMGIAGLVISAATPDMEIQPEQAAMLKDWFDNQITGSNRGRPVVLSTPVKIDTPGHSPEALALDKIAARFESRIAAALRVPLQVAGFQSSDKSKTYANYEQARAALYYDGIIPLHRRFDATLNHSFAGEYLRPSETVCRDYADVDCLAVDQTEEVKRWDMGVRGGWIKVSEARAARGLPVDPSDEVYLRPTTATVTEEYEEVEPVVTPPPGAPGITPPGGGNTDTEEPDAAP